MSKKFKHTDSFKTKERLRWEVGHWSKIAGDMTRDYSNALRTQERLSLDNRKLNDKVIADAFLIDELKHQLSQQHIQLCNMRENARGQSLERLASVGPRHTGRGPATALPERTPGVGSSSPSMPGSGGHPGVGEANQVPPAGVR
jgi:hypothetical protein